MKVTGTMFNRTVGVVAGKPQGPIGPAGTLAIGTVTTGEPGSSASVVNAGTATAAVLNFGIPKGLDASAKAALLDRVTPRHWAKVYRVNASALPSEQTGSAVFSTIAAALAQIATDRGTVLTGTGYDAGPEHRALVLIDPGTYAEQVAPAINFVDFVGSSGVASDVTIVYTGAGATMELAGYTTHVAHLTLSLGGTASGGGIYPMHADSDALAPGSKYAPQVKTFVDVTFVSTNPNRGEAAGLGIYAREQALFLDCTFTPYAGSTGVNVHNTSTQTRAGTCTFVDCAITTSGGATCMQVSDLASGNADRIVWIGGSMTTSGANQIVWTAQTGTTLQLSVDPAVVTTPILNNTNPTTVSWSSSPWSIDVDGGESSFLNDYYRPLTVGRTTIVAPPSAPDGNAALTANRLYYLPVDVGSAILTKTIRVMVGSSPTGNIAAGLYQDDGTGKPGGYLTTKVPPITATAGVMTLVCAYLRRIFPGNRTLWIGIVVTDTASKVATSSTLAGAAACYYEDLTPGFSVLPTTATPVAVTATDVVPFGTVVTQ